MVRLFDFGGVDSDRPTKDDFDKFSFDGRILDPYSKAAAFDIQKVIDDVIFNDEVVSSDIKISDRDFPQAPNFYTFCVSDKYLNQKPFLEQALIGTKVLAEFCPDCSDMEWIEHTHKVDDSLHKFENKVALLDKGKCRHCKKDRAYFVRKGTLNFYNEAALSVGQRGGKSAWLGMMAAYLTHLQLKLQKPNEVYGLLRANILHGTFAALTYAQAKDTLWEPYYGHLTDSPFFVGYHEMLNDASEKYGEELYKLKDTFCLTGETLVDTSRGLVRMDSLKVGDRCKEKNGKYKSISNWVHSGKKRIKKVLTVDGYYVKGSDDHPILTLDSNFNTVWKTIRDIRLGDYLAVNYSVSTVAKPVKFSFDLKSAHSELTRLLEDIAEKKCFLGSDITGYSSGFYRNTLGYLVQCGMLSRISTRNSREYRVTRSFSVLKAINCALSYSNRRLESIPCVTPKVLTPELALVLGYMVAEGCYNASFVFSNKNSRVLHDFIEAYTGSFGCAPSISVRLDCSNVNIQHKGIIAFLRYCGLTESVASTKSIPWCILQASRSVQVAFLQGLFEGDGNINTSARTVSYTSISETLLEQVQIMLLQHGILSKRRGSYLHLDRLNSIRYVASIGFRFKSQDLNDLDIKCYKPKFDYCAAKIPGTVGLVSGSVNARKGLFVESQFNDSEVLSKLKTENRPTHSSIQKLINSGIAWAEVSAIETEGSQDVYDITVDSKEHLFTANGILVHNCLYRHRRILVYPAGPDKRTLRGRTRFMACLDGNSLVSTSNGLQRIERDLYGERTHVGNNYFKVNNWAATGNKECFRVSAATGNYIECTANHELKTQRGWVRTDSLRKGDKIALSLGGHFPRELKIKFNPTYEPLFAAIYRTIDSLGTFELEDLQGFGRTVTPITSTLRRAGLITRHYYKGRNGSDGRCRCYYLKASSFNAEQLIAQANDDSSFKRGDATFPEVMTPELASLIGYLIADGSYNEGAAEFFFASSVSARLAHFKKCYKATFSVYPKEVKYITELGTEMTRFAISYNNLKDFFRYLGLEGVTSERKQLPWSILEAPRDCVIACLRAMYDCDGGVGRTKIFYDSVSPVLLTQVQLVLQRLGILSYKKVKSVKNDIRKHTVRSISVREPFYQRLFKELVGFSTNKLVLPTKPTTSSHLPDKDGLVLVKITGRKPLGKRKVYDITVDDEDHGFTANGVVVHNSIDELGWFPNDANNSKVKMNANEVYIALERSLLTVRASAESLIKQGFSNIPTAYFLNISSPSSVRDKIMELVRKAQGSKKIYGIIKPTWEMNPKVPRSALEEEFRKDPVAAMRDYGAEPPLTASPFISSQSAVEECFSGKPNPIRITHAQRKSKDGTITRFANLDKVGSSGKPSVLAIDAGYSNNSFACSIAHLEDHKYPRISLLVEIMPLPGIPLNYSRIYQEILGPIIDARNVVLVAADRWNSLKILSDIEDEYEIATVQHSIKYAEMQVFKSHILDGQIAYPTPKTGVDEILKYDQSDYPNCFKGLPAEHFVLQLLTVQDTGSSVTKGDQLTDDLVRASMLATTMLLDPKNAELWEQGDKTLKARFDSNQMGVYRGGSGGRSSTAGRSSVGQANPQLGMRKGYGS